MEAMASGGLCKGDRQKSIANDTMSARQISLGKIIQQTCSIRNSNNLQKQAVYRMGKRAIREIHVASLDDMFCIPVEPDLVREVGLQLSRLGITGPHILSIRVPRPKSSITLAFYAAAQKINEHEFMSLCYVATQTLFSFRK
jgi:hypothetical protein